MPAWHYPFWVAHRGAGKLAPENTLAAFRVGAGYGFRCFECDIKLSADGVPFLLHDTTLERTTTSRGIAGERRWADLSRLDAGSWHSHAFAGEPIPTLEAISSFVQANGFTLNIELKPTPGCEHETGAVVARDVARLWAGAAVWPLLSSFKPAALLGARECAPLVPRALLLDTLANGWKEAAQSIDCLAVVTEHKLMTSDMLAWLHGAGMRGLVYTVNDRESVTRLTHMGVDGIITDAVDEFSPTH